MAKADRLKAAIAEYERAPKIEMREEVIAELRDRRRSRNMPGSASHPRRREASMVEMLPVTQEDIDAAKQFMFECDPLFGDFCMKASVEIALHQLLRAHRLRYTKQPDEAAVERLWLPKDAKIVMRGSSNHGCTVEIELPGGGRHKSANRLEKQLRAILAALQADTPDSPSEP